MPYVKVESGNIGSSSEMNANFQWIGQGDKLPKGGQSLSATDGVYDLGSDSKRWGTVYLDEIPSVTTLKNTWYRIATAEITATTSSVEFTGLNGDTDAMYRILFFTRYRQQDITIFFNNDSSESYGLQQMNGTRHDVIHGLRYIPGYQTYLPLIRWVGEVGQSNFYDVLIYAKTGYERIIKSRAMGFISYTSPSVMWNVGFSHGVWNNTTDTITSIKLRFWIYDLETGTYMELYARR